jgi:hypothetical protein
VRTAELVALELVAPEPVAVGLAAPVQVPQRVAPAVLELAAPALSAPGRAGAREAEVAAPSMLETLRQLAARAALLRMVVAEVAVAVAAAPVELLPMAAAVVVSAAPVELLPMAAAAVA